MMFSNGRYAFVFVFIIVVSEWRSCDDRERDSTPIMYLCKHIYALMSRRWVCNVLWWWSCIIVTTYSVYYYYYFVYILFVTIKTWTMTYVYVIAYVCIVLNLNVCSYGVYGVGLHMFLLYTHMERNLNFCRTDWTKRTQFGVCPPDGRKENEWRVQVMRSYLWFRYYDRSIDACRFGFIIIFNAIWPVNRSSIVHEACVLRENLSFCRCLNLLYIRPLFATILLAMISMFAE